MTPSVLKWVISIVAFSILLAIVQQVRINKLTKQLKTGK